MEFGEKQISFSDIRVRGVIAFVIGLIITVVFVKIILAAVSNIYFYYTKVVLYMVIYTLIVVGLGFFVLQPVISHEKLIEKTEEVFPNFIRDTVKALRSGYAIHLALDYVARMGDYGAFNKYVKKMAAKVSWGKPFEEVIMEVAKSLKSKLILLSADIISSASKSGGKVVDVLDAISNLLDTVTGLEKERRSMLKSYCMTILVVYGAYMMSMFILTYTFLKSFVKSQCDQYIYIMYIIVIVQGFFCGLLAGYIDSLKIGGALKWALITMLLGTIFGIVIIVHPPIKPKQLIKYKLEAIKKAQKANTTNNTSSSKAVKQAMSSLGVKI